MPSLNAAFSFPKVYNVSPIAKDLDFNMATFGIVFLEEDSRVIE